MMSDFVIPLRPSDDSRDYLRRLAVENYRGFAMVHWSMTVEGRRTGWLDERAHAVWREVVLHTLHRYELAAPVYCLMPDHAHVLLIGMTERSDQRLAMSFLRKYSARMFVEVTRKGNGAEAAPLPGKDDRAFAWQRQGYDHVLRTAEQTRDGFAAVLHYVAENPVRSKLATRAQAWPYSGSIIAGWPDLDWRRDDFWDRWWTIFAGATAKGDGAGSRPATERGTRSA